MSQDFLWSSNTLKNFSFLAKEGLGTMKLMKKGRLRATISTGRFKNSFKGDGGSTGGRNERFAGRESRG